MSISKGSLRSCRTPIRHLRGTMTGGILGSRVKARDDLKRFVLQIFFHYSFFQYVKERVNREQYPSNLLDGVVEAKFLPKERCCFVVTDYKSAIPYNNSIQLDGTGLKISTSPWSVLIFANCNLISPHSYKAFFKTGFEEFFIRLNCPFKLIS